jgi:biopolymer transport protein TolR
MRLEEGQPAVSRSSARRGRRSGVSSSLAEINVVPLVDVMLVLLVIFMVAAPMMQQGFGVQLPQVRRAKPIETTTVRVTVPRTFHSNGYVWLGNDSVPLQVLPERIRQALSSQLGHNVILEGDSSVTLQDLMTVFSYLQQGGVENVSIATQPEHGGREGKGGQ